MAIFCFVFVATVLALPGSRCGEVEIRGTLRDICRVCENQQASRNSSHQEPDDAIYFYVWNKASLQNIPSHSILVFDNVITNMGNNYNTRNGKFVAPIEGAYVFAWTILNNRGHFLNVYLMVNGRYNGLAQADSRSGHQNASGSNTAVVELHKGDVVYLQCTDWGSAANHRVEGGGHSSFSGWKVASL